MSDNIQDNPFLGLFGSGNSAQVPSQNELDEGSSAASGAESSASALDKSTETSSEKDDISEVIEEVFGITISKTGTSRSLVFLEETAASLEPIQKLDMNSLEQALFERLLLEEPGKHAIKVPTMKNSAISHHIIEKEVITFLFECHRQLSDMKRWKPHLSKALSDMDEIVVRNFSTALTQPELYESQRLHIQFLDMFNDYDNSQDHLMSLVTAFVDMVLKDEGDEQGRTTLARALGPVLDEIKERAKNSSLMTLNRYHIYLIKFFSTNLVLGDILLQHSTPKDGDGSLYADTLLGSILATSCLPRSGIRYQQSEQFVFDRSMESGFWTGLNFVCDSIHTVFFNIFKNSIHSRHALLSWIGQCLHTNASRGKLANSHENELSVFAALSSVSDGFMLNLCGVLLRLCKPFMSKSTMAKILKVDPTYCSVEASNSQEANDRWLHMRGMSSETCLISLTPSSETLQTAERPSAHSFNFLTEMFFMTHRALDLGVRVVFEKWMQLNQELGRTQRQLEQTQTRLPETAQTLRQILETNMTRSYAMRATLLEPGFVALMGEFYVATAEWLIQVAIQPPGTEQQETFAPLQYRVLSFPLPEAVSPALSCVPEFLVENIACYQSMVRRFAPQTLEQNGADFLVPLLSLVLVFMGCKQRMRNPHLRARLAECLESLLPNRDSFEIPPGYHYSGINREDLFKTHPHRNQIVPCLLDVFVGIEVTGESVAFEQKFNYRRPMYVAMDYLWTLQEQKEVFNSLAVEAEANMGAVKPPLFLRFINLLINDAIFLLDEALSNMAQLRTMHTARDNGEWDAMTPNERQQNEGRLVHIGMIARFDNILGKETIHTLQYITTEITSIFCDPTLVDRIASMLNYFLVHLVGPNQKNFKVKDQHDYDFKPKDLVMDICRIYINLGKSDEFCLAVSRDGRSYRPILFVQAEQVLVRIGGGIIIADLMQVANKVAELAVQQNEEDELFADGPEEFYDPILSTLMVDPVILPSSRTVCDRDTIARHLLSDQTDPFTKAPLTLEQVIPDDQLKQRIEAWKNERRSLKACASSSAEENNILKS